MQPNQKALPVVGAGYVRLYYVGARPLHKERAKTDAELSTKPADVLEYEAGRFGESNVYVYKTPMALVKEFGAKGNTPGKVIVVPADRWGELSLLGKLSEKKVQKMVHDYERAAAAGPPKLIRFKGATYRLALPYNPDLPGDHPEYHSEEDYSVAPIARRDLLPALEALDEAMTRANYDKAIERANAALMTMDNLRQKVLDELSHASKSQPTKGHSTHTEQEKHREDVNQLWK